MTWAAAAPPCTFCLVTLPFSGCLPPATLGSFLKYEPKQHAVSGSLWNKDLIAYKMILKQLSKSLCNFTPTDFSYEFLEGKSYASFINPSFHHPPVNSLTTGALLCTRHRNKLVSKTRHGACFQAADGH